ncbi:EAL domain-containing protein [Agrobacterium rubi]|nr:EAL domain-containing protein [Agrobacterium rubi]NTF24903.1 EAL domain-containing protein [Agrobacterium rubi]
MLKTFGSDSKSMRARLAAMTSAIAVASAAVGYGFFELVNNEPDFSSILGGFGTVTALSVGAFAATFSSTRGLVSGIAKLRNATTVVGSGDLDVAVPRLGCSETDDLVKDFNRMVADLRSKIGHLHTLAYQDAVTGLSNRTVLGEVLDVAINFNGGAVISIDLDRFNEVNQAFGHQVGDALLRQVAQRLIAVNLERSEGAMDNDIKGNRLFESFEGKRMLFRSSADEFFAVILQPSTDLELASLSQAIIDSLAEPFLLGGSEIRIGGSVGIVRIGRDAAHSDELGRFADLAMAEAKRQGGGRYVFFNAKLRAAAARRAQLERDIKFAIPNDELVVHFQPKVSVSDGTLMGVEALVRWQHPSKGLLYPGDFLPIAEEKGMMSQLGRKVFELSALQVREWQKQGLWTRVAINVCPTQFMNTNFADETIALAKSMGVLPQQFVLEITETVAMSNAEAANDQLSKLKRAGFKIAIDDFGVGYSNLAQLYRLQFDFIKVDRSLVERIDADVNAQRIITFTIGMAHSMGKHVVAEGIETEGQRRELVKLGCDYAQGYLFGKPMPASEIIDIYGKHAVHENLPVVAAA